MGNVPRGEIPHPAPNLRQPGVWFGTWCIGVALMEQSVIDVLVDG